MTVEAATFINDLTVTNPPGTDVVSEGDNHLRLLKTVLKATIPNADRAWRFPEGAAKTANYTVLAADDNKILTADCTGGAIGFTLPATAGIPDGWEVGVVKIDTGLNALTVTPAAGTINGQTNMVFPFGYSGARVRWTGTVWEAESFKFPAPWRVVTKTANATLVHGELRSLVIVTPAASNATITLPTAVGRVGEWVAVKRNHATFTVTLDGNSSETIDGALTYSVGANQACALIVSDGANWRVATTITGIPLGIDSGGTGQITALLAFNALSPLTTKGDLVSRDTTNNVRVGVGANEKVLEADATASAGVAWDWPVGSLLAVVEDRKSAGADGGSASAGNTHIRTLNTEVYDRDSIVTLASNRFTLIAGTYEIEWSAPANKVGLHQTFLYNQTDAAEVARGASAFASDAGFGQTVSAGLARVTITGTKSFEIRHYTDEAEATFGLGRAVGNGGEVYTRVIIRKG